MRLENEVDTIPDRIDVKLLIILLRRTYADGQGGQGGIAKDTGIWHSQLSRAMKNGDTTYIHTAKLWNLAVIRMKMGYMTNEELKRCIVVEK